ncbi:NADP-dependent oxidoreductase [Aeromicrobium sp. Leaf350]|uniref:NADP-dependent oxidoreductase n=1 Tax=Aeromicrobium sp. Leaf350 TaxID=2876565 RepID=UPI001E2DEB32|nr:NADP-dependent oxidoreductase [Aeromicrobium sp. Leaf350]
MWPSRDVILRERPSGLPDASTWEVLDRSVPDPAPGQFVVAVDYVSVDPGMRGWLNDVRSYLEPVAIGDAMRANAAATVVASRHDGFPVGSTVTGMFGVCEHAISDGQGVRLIDTRTAESPTWLGALGIPGMTAYVGLLRIGRLSAGETVLISAAAGAVGSVAGQIAKAMGCTVVGLAGTEEKRQWLLDLGFDHAIDYRSENVSRALRGVAPQGVDVFFDNVGGEILDAGLANLARGARIVLCGAVSSYNSTTLPPGPRRYMSLLVARASMTGFVIFDHEDEFAEAEREIAGWIADGTLVARETVVDGGVDAFGQTLLALYQGANTGKLVLQVRDSTS